MSYTKVQQLANKFAKTAVAVEYYSAPQKTDHFVNSFLRNIRIALNELEGDLMTLKYKNFNRKQWKELGDFWKNCIEIYKGFNENKPEEGVQEFVDFLLEKKDWLNQINSAVQRHLKTTEIDFVPHPNLSQARADGIKEVIKAVNEGAQQLKKNDSATLPKAVQTPSSHSTFIGSPGAVNRDEKTQISDTPVKKEVR